MWNFPYVFWFIWNSVWNGIKWLAKCALNQNQSACNFKAYIEFLNDSCSGYDETTFRYAKHGIFLKGFKLNKLLGLTKCIFLKLSNHQDRFNLNLMNTSNRICAKNWIQIRHFWIEPSIFEKNFDVHMENLYKYS